MRAAEPLAFLLPLQGSITLSLGPLTGGAHLLCLRAFVETSIVDV